VLRAATSHASELLAIEEEVGTLEVGKRADILIHDQNPLTDFKLLYGTGAVRLNEETNGPEFKRCLKKTIRGGMVYDVDELLTDVREMVAGTWPEASRNSRTK
jgi:predicted amidohydrolase